MNPVFMFSGQGAQKPGMGESLFCVPEVKAVLDCASDVLGYDVAALMTSAPAEKLNDPRYAQPATCALSVGIASALQARGADFETGSLMQRAKALVPLLVPLFVSAFRRADELATAMECRCYHGGDGRTKLHVLRYEARDYLVLGYYLALAAGVILLR